MSKEIKQDFELFCSKQPNLSSILCFNRYLWLHKHKKFSRAKIVKLFGELVDKSDYLQSEKQSLLNWVVDNYSEGGKIKASKKPL